MNEPESTELPARKIKISETFYSVQGEGRSVGVPAVFLRLSGCDFQCSWCDTIETWKKGTFYTYDELDALFERNNYWGHMRKGARLIITGGNPLLHQTQLLGWLKRLEELERKPERLSIEIETQGSIMPLPALSKWVRQWNVSPKLANSGIALEKRIRPEILGWHSSTNSWFKFPVASATELAEIESIVRQCGLKRTRVMLMPVCSTRETHAEALLSVATMAKHSGFILGLRLHLMLWNKTTGV